MSDQALSEIKSHEKECAVRYESIERQMQDGKVRFNKLENMITGLYGVIITGGLAVFGVVATLAIRLV